MFEQAKGVHSIIVENRRKVIIEGVKDVESFNENDVVVITHSGGLKIKGKNLEISKMNIEPGNGGNGLLEMTGVVQSLHYSDSDRTPNNIITKLFR
ncbi:MAG: YabP/YqfC family sporulation protein [Oscillospiraceae bacterium]|nr:YabP/YqfC family sporulation protein [Oscillospiraceae bacterium]